MLCISGGAALAMVLIVLTGADVGRAGQLALRRSARPAHSGY